MKSSMFFNIIPTKITTKSRNTTNLDITTFRVLLRVSKLEYIYKIKRAEYVKNMLSVLNFNLTAIIRSKTTLIGDFCKYHQLKLESV